VVWAIGIDASGSAASDIAPEDPLSAVGSSLAAISPEGSHATRKNPVRQSKAVREQIMISSLQVSAEVVPKL